MWREIGKHLVNGKQHVTRISLLLIVSVDFRPYVKIHWIDARSQIGADRTISRTRLCTHKVLLFLLIHLSGPIGDIVEANVAEDVAISLLCRAAFTCDRTPLPIVSGVMSETRGRRSRSPPTLTSAGMTLLPC